MATLLLNLRNVPDDEIEEVRALLDKHGIEYYETPPNRWGISMGAIWIKGDDQADEAKSLLASYQQHRSETARAEHARRREEGTVETIWHKLRRQPIQVIVYLGVVALILYFSIKPFIDLGQ